jgi:hypothetical protein
LGAWNLGIFGAVIPIIAGSSGLVKRKNRLWKNKCGRGLLRIARKNSGASKTLL